MTLAMTPEPQTKRWTRQQFYWLAEQGLVGKHAQLIDGEIIEMSPQAEPHAMALTWLNHWAVGVFGKDHLVRIQMPLNATEYSDPEPDLAVIRPPRTGRREHPETALLIIEVSDSSLRLDRRKAKVYAEAKVQDYWIVNIPDSQVEVHRKPAGQRYEDVRIYKRDEKLSPLARPQATLDITDLFK
jgi:Uma2 family endonuclease